MHSRITNETQMFLSLPLFMSCHLMLTPGLMFSSQGLKAKAVAGVIVPHTFSF